MTVPKVPANSYIISMVQMTIQDSLIKTPYCVTGSDLNQYAVMHGGRLLTLADEVGYLSAFRVCQTPCMTRAVYQAQFLHPAPLNARLQCMAQTLWAGKTSLWTDITIYWQQHTILHALYVYVIRKQNKATTLPRLIAQSPEERKKQAQCRQLYEQYRQT